MTSTIFAILVFAFATGIFAVLSALEKPVYRLMWNHRADVPDDDVRRIHAVLKRLINILPPTMMTAMALGLVMLIVQLFERSFDIWGWVALGTFLVLQGGISIILMPRIEAVKTQSPDHPIAALRKGTGELAAVHHMGLGTTALMAVGLALLLTIASH